MSFGIYVHIPYCLQRCTYCDFATYEQSQILPPTQYVQLVLEEMRQKLPSLVGRIVDTVYFGGGTPSLIPAELIVAILRGVEKEGLKIRKDAEITIEINPATLDRQKMETYLKSGINRFSVGAQTFDDALLKMVHREHNAAQTRETLNFLKAYGVNYSFDLLFALPGQNIDMLKLDLEEVLSFSPPHLSPYCLTVPEGHVLSKRRALEDDQVQMFELISKSLTGAGYARYEISNFCKPGFESQHNSLYWDDSEYLGLGLGSHSYINLSEDSGPWGTRFWNPNAIAAYESQVKGNQGKAFPTPFAMQTADQVESLEVHQALTDFCHTSLRMSRGLSVTRLTQKFGPQVSRVVDSALHELTQRSWVSKNQDSWCLTEQGVVLSNQVFAALTYLKGELSTP
jgi:oxygen-independent coproporphyrinogen-3 oxidase